MKPSAWIVTAVLALAACNDSSDKPWSGYAEGDYVYIAAPLAGTLSRLAVAAGQQVKRGTPLFELESGSEEAARDEARARLASARAQALDTEKGRRPPEIAVQRAQLEQARAQQALAEREFARKSSVAEGGAVSREDLDQSRAAAVQARARVAELEAALQVAHLPARGDTQAAAQAQVEAAQQALQQAQWRTGQKQQTAPQDAVVSDTFFRPGEFVAAGQPVLALLPAANIKARFYVAENELHSIALGRSVKLSCDGCGAPIDARVSFIATQPEYTPPVIYSNSQRAKLVFLIEARPAPADARRLRPGQPLDVRPAGNATGS
ncbi:MAG TPA: HlyD family efflux transporter periplasmic adaptor subunit [Ramlibacter sp.]|uniref:HlyD family secretion protein n=1 Tax=Ramlibacter sp. TaxID=1917967 RepID=UPI002CC3DE96|nr:HlyD family efflux transporter periplasmic adaptor subunit [Ramlibacter sp.]HVZ45871.1 HlyD family efflux transporter periplasmic adaptor subunit [Ramlibacter sp.]